MTRLSWPRIVRVASFRFAALYVALFAGSAMLLGGAVFLEARAALQAQVSARIESELAFLTAEYHAEGLAHLLDLVRLRGRGAGALDYLVQDASGAHLGGEIPARGGLRPGWTMIDVPQSDDDGPQRGGGGGEQPERVRALVADLGGTLLAVGGDTRQIGDLEEAVATALAWAVGLAAVLGIGGGALLSRAFLRRVDAISRTAEAIIAGDLTRRVPLRGTGDDLDRLAGTLNHMLDRIGVLMESLRQVSSDIAHDLRTPLTRLYQRLDQARTHGRSVEEDEAALDGAVAEAQGLLEIFAALLRIAQVEGGSPRDAFTTVDLSVLTETVADAYRPEAEDAGDSLTAAITPGVTVRGDKELLAQALSNLVENALHHTGAGTRIGIELATGPGGEARLAVQDDGPGVPQADLGRLTGRFYRSERSRSTPGNGLGLSLVAAIADLHRARLDLALLHPGFRAGIVFGSDGGSGRLDCEPDESGAVCGRNKPTGRRP